jgi:hypothetical protein
MHAPMPSNGNASKSNESKAKENFYLSEGKKNNKRRSGDVLSSSCSPKSGGTSKKPQNLDINLDWDETFEDAFATDIEVADIKNRIQVENPFAFGKWQSMLVGPRKSTPSTENLEILQYKVDLHHSKQLSSFAKTDCCSTNFNSCSTRNTPIISDELHICKTDSEETYAIY